MGETSSLPGGHAEFLIPLALDDPPGLWQVSAREPFSHQTAQTTFEVTPP